jgi:hypothetical protein
VKVGYNIAVGLAMVSTLVAQQPQAPQGGGGGRAAIQPRIMQFEARPSTIRPGESAQLVWQTEAAGRGLTIDPEVGPIAARGSKQVSPTQTTTYTLKVNANVTKTITVTVAGAPVAKAASNSAGNSKGRIDGHPDFTGVYGNAGLPQGAQAPPLKPGAEKFRIVRVADDIRGRTTIIRNSQDCSPLGIPQTYITPYPWQFIQTPKLMVQVFEYPNAIRFIPLDGRPLPADPDPTWMGSAVGRWDGDTLVIESAGFNDKTEVHGFMHTQSLHVIERFKKMENGSLQYEVTVEDPNVWTGPWAIPARTFQFRPETEWVDEFVCDAPPVDYEKLLGKH